MSAVFAQSDCNESNWQEYYNSDGKDMSYCQLQKANLIYARLRGANLYGATLEGATLVGANLRGADLTNVNLKGAYFEGAVLENANLGGADLKRAILEGVESRGITGRPRSLPDGWSLVDGTLIKDEWGSSNPPDDMMADGANLTQSDCNKDNWQEYYNSEGRDMTDCDFSGVNLEGADLRGAILTGAILTGINLTNAKLTEANLKGADLSGAYLTGAYLGGANLKGATLGGAYLGGAILREVDLEGADLSGAYLTGAYLGGANLKGAYLTNANLTGAILREVDLTNANLKGAYLGGADLRGAYLTGTNLTNANLKGVYLTEATLESADLTGAIFTQSDNDGAPRVTPPSFHIEKRAGFYKLFINTNNSGDYGRKEVENLYIVNTKEGLNIRDNNSSDGNKIAGLPYGSLVYISKVTSKKITINDVDSETGISKIIEGNWVKIVSIPAERNPLPKNTIVGYAFDGFLTKLKTDSYNNLKFLEAENRVLYSNLTEGETYLYKGQKYTGVAISFYDNGQLQFAASYIDGKLNGWWRKWEENGAIFLETEYENGEMVSEIDFN